MSFERFYNKESLVDLNQYQYGQLFSSVDLDLLNTFELSPYDPKLIDNNLVEVHLYSLNGDYLGQDNNAAYVVVDEVSNSLLINIREVFNISGIDRGAYKVIVNMLRPLLGTSDQPIVFIKEIGTGAKSRDEVRLDLIPGASDNQILALQNFAQAINQLVAEDVLNHVVVNFGFNKIIKVRNIKFDLTEKSMFIKAYDSIADDITEKDSGYIGFEIIDPYIDTVVLTAPIEPAFSNTMRGPNFDIDNGIGNSKSTVFKSFNDLLTSDATTNQKILNDYVSGSDEITLNIDYTDYENFVFYGSAQERIENFKYKLELVEYYDQQIGSLNDSSGSANIPQLQANNTVFTKRKDNLISSFSPFEKWLYYEPTGSIFTHGVTGSLTPFPKYTSGSRQFVHHTTSSLAVNWYNTEIVSSSAYDKENYNRLANTTPDHIVRDPNNSQYLVFLDMIGEHFDELYAFTKGLTSIYERDEHPSRGMPNELLPSIAESMGWQVQSVKDTSDLWLYSAGLNSSGSLVETGSLKSLPHKNLNYQVWRRIVNNMPYLLKSKGSARAVKALISIYGIPHTLISIKEYGGAPKETFKPALIDDHFSYKLNFDGEQQIETAWNDIPTGSKWGYSHYPKTVEFRFSTEYSASVSQSLWSLEGNNTSVNLETVHSNAHYTSSYSGSYDYGYLRMFVKDDNGTFDYMYVSSSYLPIYDGDMWNVMLNANEGTDSIDVYVQKASDCVDGQIVHSASFSTLDDYAAPDYSDLGWFNPTAESIIGGSLKDNQFVSYNDVHRFSGSIQAYKEYTEIIKLDTFNDHTLNPAAYHGNSPTSSYYTLYKYFPLGIDGRREDHSVVTEVTSSQPDRSVNAITTGSFVGFTGDQTTQYTSFREQHYVYTPTIGGNNIISDKVRLEDNSLMWDLSPDARAEKSRYDFAPIDNNRLAIVFSPTDQINREIFNHTGFAELDDYIGDPSDQFEYQYKDLRGFSEEYWKKWSRKYNINEFIKIFSVYDYTIFEQIRQTIPARADLIDGVLIEPHILERPKVIINRPSIEQLQHDTTLTLFNNRESGEVLTQTSSIDATSSIESSYCYYTSSAFATSSIFSEYCYYTSSAAVSASLTGSYCYNTASLVLYDVYSGSIGETGSYVDKCTVRCDYQRVIFHYSSSADGYLTKYKRQFATFVSKSYGLHYSKSVVNTCYQIEECSPYNRARFVGSKLTGADFNVDSTDTIDGGPVVWFQESDPNRIIVSGDSSQGNLKVE